MSSPWSIFSKLGVFIAVVFVLNLAWEMAQMRLYVQMAAVPWTESLWPCAWAAFGDVLFALFIYGLGVLASGQLSWGVQGGMNTLVAAGILGACLATGYEWRSQLTGRWTYTEEMPIIPALGVGLWPLLQLMLTVPAAFWVAHRYQKWRFD